MWPACWPGFGIYRHVAGFAEEPDVFWSVAGAVVVHVRALTVRPEGFAAAFAPVRALLEDLSFQPVVAGDVPAFCPRTLFDGWWMVGARLCGVG